MLAKMIYVLVVLSLAVLASANNPRLDGRIINGFPLEIRNAPYQVSLRSWDFHICGGSIVAKYWVLTAAHCTINKTPDQISFLAGSTNIYDDSEGTVHQAERIIIHENYDPRTLDYDFSLVKVKTPFPIGNPGVEIAELSDEEPTSGWMLASGWGATQVGGGSPANLQGVYVHMIDRETCDISYGKGRISSRMICAADAGKDSCQGDSGGPLFSRDSNKLVGVVSWGIGCADPRYPGVYSNIADQLDWIRENIEKN